MPEPRYLLRRDRVRRAMQRIHAGHLLEIGPGAGALLVEFATAGFQCEALEPSTPARDLTGKFLKKFDLTLPVHRQSRSTWVNQFDIICAFDVLEHIELDADILSLWCTWLKPGGAFMISVPAHVKRWNARDVWAGHFRRYERATFISLLESKHLSVELVECYGFPLANLTETLGDKFYRKSLKERVQRNEHMRQQGNDLSGIDRTTFLNFHPLLTSMLGKISIWFFVHLQRLFLNTNFGNGYLVIAVKK
jgi:SAM-dependent methyltransferase